jgi:protein-disulfide isomerase
MSSRQEQKAAARAAREQAQREATGDQRRRRLLQLGGALALAAIIAVVIVVATSGGGGSDKKATETGASGAEASQLLGGIPERGMTLGRASAPVTIVEFNDMQCPICKQYTTDVFPTLVRKYVRTGKVRMEMRLQSFIGPDSVRAGKAVAAAAAQDKAWLFSDIFYNDQGEENTGYVTDGFLRSIGKATAGLDVAKLMRDIDSPAAAQALKDGQRDFESAGFQGTPSFLLGRTGQKLTRLDFTALTPEQFTGPIDKLLAK